MACAAADSRLALRPFPTCDSTAHSHSHYASQHSPRVLLKAISHADAAHRSTSRFSCGAGRARAAARAAARLLITSVPCMCYSKPLAMLVLLIVWLLDSRAVQVVLALLLALLLACSSRCRRAARRAARRLCAHRLLGVRTVPVGRRSPSVRGRPLCVSSH